MSILIAIVVGALIGSYGVYAVVFAYKYKGTSKATMARILAVSSVAVIASIGLYLLQYIFLEDSELDFRASLAFCVSGIISMIVFFWINKNKIG